LTQDQRVDVVRPLLGIDRLEVGHVAHRVVLDEYAVSAQQPNAALSSAYGAQRIIDEMERGGLD